MLDSPETYSMNTEIDPANPLAGAKAIFKNSLCSVMQEKEPKLTEEGMSYFKQRYLNDDRFIDDWFYNYQAKHALFIAMSDHMFASVCANPDGSFSAITARKLQQENMQDGIALVKGFLNNAAKMQND